MMKLVKNGVFGGRIMRNVHLSASRGFALLSAVAFALLAGGAFAGADDIRTWTDASGDHRFHVGHKAGHGVARRGAQRSVDGLVLENADFATDTRKAVVVE